MLSKKLLTIAFLGHLFWSTMPASMANESCADSTTEQVSQIASANVDYWATQTLMIQLMKQEISVNELTLGTPFRVHTILPESLWAYQPESELTTLLEFMNTWFTMVFFKEKPVFFLKVGCRDNQLSAIGTLSSEALGEELNTLFKQLASIDSKQHWFVQVHQTKHTFLMVKHNGNEVIYPLLAFPTQYTGIETIDELGGYNPLEVISEIKTQLPKPIDATLKTLESSFTSSTGLLLVPKVVIDEKASYTVVMQQESGKLLFSVTDVIPVPTFEEMYQSIVNGQTKQEVVQLLGFPMITYNLVKKELFMGPAPNNLNTGDPYEQWEYSVAGSIYLVWFAATPDHRASIWTVVGKTTYPEDTNF